jgi:hypothetical protein
MVRLLMSVATLDGECWLRSLGDLSRTRQDRLQHGRADRKYMDDETRGQALAVVASLRNVLVS